MSVITEIFHVIYKIQTVLPRCVVDIVVGGQLPCPSLTLRGHGLLYSKPSTNVFQLLDFKLYKVYANQLSKQ